MPPLTFRKGTSFFFYLVLLEKLIPERADQASPPPCTPLERCILAGPSSPLTINRHCFETPHTQFPSTSIKCHANEGDMHSGLFEKARESCYFACMYCWFQS